MSERTVVKFRYVHDHSPQKIVLPGRVSLAEVADHLNRTFCAALHLPLTSHLIPTLRIRIIGTGPKAGEVTVTLGPFAIEGWVTYESSSAPPPPRATQSAS